LGPIEKQIYEMAHFRWHIDCQAPHTAGGPAVFFVPEPGNAGLTPPEINAALFYQLAQFIVWGEFLYLSDLRERFRRRGHPIISVDTKKRELVGVFKNPGARWDLSSRLVNDHDFLSDAIGVAIPYGIYDLLANRGSVVVGISHDTPAFAAHAISHWWHKEGSLRYPRSRQILILSDTGGSNSYRCRAWKTQLQAQLADSFGLTLTVAHYPTGASKWNPIEHRLFSEISKNWAGEPLHSYKKVLRFIRSTKTQTGLSVTAHLDRRQYLTGTEPTAEELQALRIQPHEVLPRWNYTISPNL